LKQKVDLGDFITGPFPGKGSPPSEVIVTQKGRRIKKIVAKEAFQEE
jgi:hypothetical protein